MIDPETKRELSGIWAALVALLFLAAVNLLAMLALMRTLGA